MAALNHLPGYDCEFFDSVPEDFYCKHCKLVARRCTITSCCGENYCLNCIADTQEQGKPCPVCVKKGFNLMEQIKCQKKIGSLKVYCSMKKRGCGWSGILEQLEPHLDPDKDDCQYVDTSCPLNCHVAIPKNEVEQHVAQHCVKRPYACQHCNFKGIYEEVMNNHIPECRYVPLQCPNFCGVTFERDFMEGHMKTCRLEEVGCKFRGVGCQDQFRREDQEKHIQENTQEHLMLTSKVAIETREQLLDQLTKYRQIEQTLEQKLVAQEQKIKEQEQKLKKQEQMLKEHHQVLKGLSVDAKAIITSLLPRTFTLENFSKEKESGKSLYSVWYSPDMYTHLGGYKFRIGVFAYGFCDGRGKAMAVYLYSLPGEFDNQLKWPAEAKFALELVNQRGRDNARHEVTTTWDKPVNVTWIDAFGRIKFGPNIHFMEHSYLRDYLEDNRLHFNVSNILILN